MSPSHVTMCGSPQSWLGGRGGGGGGGGGHGGVRHEPSQSTSPAGQPPHSPLMQATPAGQQAFPQTVPAVCCTQVSVVPLNPQVSQALQSFVQIAPSGP